MSGITNPSALSRRRFWPVNGARLNCRTFGRRSRPSHGCLATGRAATPTTPPKAATNTASFRIRSHFSVPKCFGWYARQQHQRPYITEACSVALIYCVGDFAAQILDADGYEAQRTARSIIIGAVVSIPSYKWFRFLSRHFNYSSAVVSTWTKVVVNQLVWTPLFNVYFFAFHAILSGMAMTGVVERVKMTVPTSLPRSFLYWPFVTAFNFTYVQPQSRSVVTAIFAVLWQSYMSWLNAQAQRHEEGYASTFNLPE